MSQVAGERGGQGGVISSCLEIECCFLAEGKRGQGHSEQRNTFNFLSDFLLKIAHRLVFK